MFTKGSFTSVYEFQLHTFFSTFGLREMSMSGMIKVVSSNSARTSFGKIFRMKKEVDCSSAFLSAFSATARFYLSVKMIRCSIAEIETAQ